MNRLLEKTAANISEYPGERKIFGKYLHLEGLDREIFCFRVFRKYVYKYLINSVKNIWNKALVVVDQPEVEFLDLDQN